MTLQAAHYRTGRVREFENAAQSPAGQHFFFGPAFLDLQCNGFAGVDFNHPATTPEQVANAVEAMRSTGCTRVFPTIITHGPERMEHLLHTLDAACARFAQVAGAVPGLHLEGPFLSAIDGARGAHPAEHIRPPSVALWRKLQRAAGGRIRLVTLAPEARGAAEFIRRMRAEGVTVALGHTMANREQIAAAAHAGATLSTHLGNGCPEFLHRHENALIAQLVEDQLCASITT